MGNANKKESTMKAAVHNPYLDTLGGGERYTLTVAKALVEFGYKVDLEWKDKAVIKKIERRFGMDLSSINVVDTIKRGDGYDVCFWLSDGSIPTLKSRNNLLHFQEPFVNVDGTSLLNRMKLFRINHIVCNSAFTKGFIDKEYSVDSKVVYPPVDINSFKAKGKQNIILFVGRFSQLKQSKNQHILLKAFKNFYDYGYRNYRLVLAGGVEVGVGDYLDKLKKEAQGYPVIFEESPDFIRLKGLYGKAKIFWSAVGYGEDEHKRPQKVEHFGITLVEAMASGCAVFALNAGGYKEIVDHGEDGILWRTQEELVSETIKVIESKSSLSVFSKRALKKSKSFSEENFINKIKELL